MEQHDVFLRRSILISIMLAIFGFSHWMDQALLGDTPSVRSIFKTKNAAKPNKEYTLAEEHGPWLILAYAFDGENAREKANELAFELRSTFDLKAYVTSKSFDHTEKVLGSGIDNEGRPKPITMKYQDNRVVNGYAVLVGDFTSLDNPKLKETLDKIKHLQPVTLAKPAAPGINGRGTNGKSASSAKMATIKEALWRKNKDESDRKKGPMGGAIASRNPLLPESYFKQPTVDSFVASLNKEYEHSLLKCKGDLTVVVATQKGNEIVQRDLNNDNVDKDPSKDKLAIAGEMAHWAVTALRSQGIEAYEFHDRTQSLVTVGSFKASSCKVDSQGNDIFDPGIRDIMSTFGGSKGIQDTQIGQFQKPKTLYDIVPIERIPKNIRSAQKKKEYHVPFDIQPRIMAVPRVESSSIYSGSLLGR